MTVKELYEWALENNAENLPIEIQHRDSCGEYDGVDECEPLVAKSFYDDVPVVLL